MFIFGIEINNIIIILVIKPKLTLPVDLETGLVQL
jgi:hypothetical protein